jgi:hypothetical protein
MRKGIALLIAWLCLIGSVATDACHTWGKVQEIDRKGNAVIETLEGELYAVSDDSLYVGMYLSLVIDAGLEMTKNDDIVVDYTEIEHSALVDLWRL